MHTSQCVVMLRFTKSGFGPLPTSVIDVAELGAEWAGLCDGRRRDAFIFGVAGAKDL